MKPGATHGTFYRGKRVRVILRTGEFFVDKFVRATKDSLVFASNTVNKSKIRATVIER